MIITLSGLAGSGKSTTAKYLAKKLSLKHYSTGDFMRAIANERGVSILELNKLSETDKSIDNELDQRQILLGKNEDTFIIDGRLSFHFIPRSLKIFLTADPLLRAQRIFRDQRATEKNVTLEDTMKHMLARQQSEKKRYMALYHVDYLNEKNYDLVIDTTGLTIEQTGDAIIRYVQQSSISKRKKNNTFK